MREPKNKDIRAHAQRKGVYLYEVAAAMGISDPTFTRRLRNELSADDKAAIKRIIDDISAARAAAC